MDRWISARTPLVASAEQATTLLMDDSEALIPASRPGTSAAMVIDLSVAVGGGSAIRQDVEVALGAPRSAEGEAWVPISWEPTSHARMLPSFDGALGVVNDGGGRTELSITGTYHVPLGIVGRFGDGVVGRRVAQQSLRVLLQRIAQHIDERIAEQLAHAGWKPAPYPVDLRERGT